MSFFYAEIVFCRTRFFHYEILKGFSPDIVFSGIAERYFSKCDMDEDRPNFFTYPLIKQKMLKPNEGFSDLFSEFFDMKKLLIQS